MRLANAPFASLGCFVPRKDQATIAVKTNKHNCDHTSDTIKAKNHFVIEVAFFFIVNTCSCMAFIFRLFLSPNLESQN
jgi:hypothetical protein